MMGDFVGNTKTIPKSKRVSVIERARRAEKMIKFIEAQAKMTTDPHAKAYMQQTAARMRADPDLIVLKEDEDDL